MSPSRGTIFFIFSLLCLSLSWICQADGHDNNGHKQCYLPSGGVSFGTPCHQDRDVSHCCGYGWTCLSNGLCKSSATNERDYRSKVFRTSCTDHSWTSPNCTQVCRGPEDNLDGVQGVRICDEAEGTYCCQRDYDCCENPSLILNLGPANTMMTIIRPTSLPEEEKKGPVGKETIIGIGGGFAIAAGVFVLAWAFLIYRRRRKGKQLNAKDVDDEKGQPKELDATDTMVETERPSSYMAPGDSSNPVELESTNTRSELESLPSASTITRRGTENTLSTISPMSPGTLITPDILEMEAPFKTPNSPSRPG